MFVYYEQGNIFQLSPCFFSTQLHVNLLLLYIRGVWCKVAKTAENPAGEEVGVECSNPTCTSYKNIVQKSAVGLHFCGILTDSVSQTFY